MVRGIPEQVDQGGLGLLGQPAGDKRVDHDQLLPPADRTAGQGVQLRRCRAVELVEQPTQHLACLQHVRDRQGAGRIQPFQHQAPGARVRGQQPHRPSPRPPLERQMLVEGLSVGPGHLQGGQFLAPADWEAPARTPRATRHRQRSASQRSRWSATGGSRSSQACPETTWAGSARWSASRPARAARNPTGMELIARIVGARDPAKPRARRSPTAASGWSAAPGPMPGAPESGRPRVLRRPG